METCGVFTIASVLSRGIRANLNSSIVDDAAGLPRLITSSIPEAPEILKRESKTLFQVYNPWKLPDWLDRRFRQPQTNAHGAIPPAERFSGYPHKADRGLLVSGPMAGPDRFSEGPCSFSSPPSKVWDKNECPLRPPDRRSLRHCLGRVAMTTTKCVSLLVAWLAVLVMLNAHYLRSLNHQSTGKNCNLPRRAGVWYQE